MIPIGCYFNRQWKPLEEVMWDVSSKVSTKVIKMAKGGLSRARKQIIGIGSWQDPSIEIAKL